MTNGQFVAEVRNHLKALTKDEHVSARYILSTAKSYIQYLINTRPLSKIYRDGGSFISLNCLELKSVDKVSCNIAEFKICDNIMKSVKKIPEIYNSQAGFVIESVTNMDGSIEYEPLRSLADFKTTMKRTRGGMFKYYMIIDEYLYLLNTENESVNIQAMFLDEQEVKKVSECNECDECASKLENKFVCPSEYVSTVRDQTVNLILGTNRRIVSDEHPDLDSNQKSRKE